MLSLRFDIRDLQWLLWLLVPIMTFHAALSLNVYDRLMPLSYLLQFLDLFGMLGVVYMFLVRPVLNHFEFLTLLYVLFLLAVTIIMSSAIKSMIFSGADILYLVLIFNYCKTDKIALLVKLLTLSMSACVYINFVSLLLDPSWMVEADKELTGYILGNNYNQMGSRIIIALACCLLSLNYGKRWLLNFVATYICGVLSVAFVGSMTSTANILMVLVFCLVTSISLKRLGFFSLLLFYMFFQIAVCFNGKGVENSDLAVYIIVDLLGKDITFTLRTEKWDAALRVFTQSPLIGYGFVDQDWFYAHISGRAMGPHNLIFYIMLTGGVVLLTAFIVLVGMAVIRCLQQSAATKTKYNLLFCLSVMLFMQTMEYYPLFFNLLLAYLIYYFPEIQKTWESRPQLSVNR